METHEIDKEITLSNDIAAFMTRVYSWMTLGLLLTAVVALLAASSEAFVTALLGNQLYFWGLMLGTFGIVMWLSAAAMKMSPEKAAFLFLVYAALNGLMFSVLFFAFTSASIALTFFITAGTFGAMSVYGMVTKQDLSRLGNIALMGLIGIIIASLANLFMKSDTMHWIISYLGVAIFVVLTAYDTQKLKRVAMEVGSQGDMAFKASIMGALTLYLDFINLFLFLLRLFGRRD